MRPGVEGCTNSRKRRSVLRGRAPLNPPPGTPARSPVAVRLGRPAEIRRRCREILAIGERGALPHFDVRTDRLPAAADIVAGVTRERYPDLVVPPHSRWRHFEAGGRDRWNALARGLDPDERARAAFDLVVPSVLLDAGAGPGWRYREAGTGQEFARSEGLAVASFAMFSAGAFSSDAARPLRADASALRACGPERLAAALRAGPGNRLEGMEGRAGLLRALGEALEKRPDLFGSPSRVGGLYDRFRALPAPPSAAEVLETLLDALHPVWPERVVLHGASLGDVWRHPSLRRDDETDRLVPFHKLTQWLAYSLMEPLAEAGIRLRDPDGLTGLAEYRNGGLFIDAGVLEPREKEAFAVEHPPGAELVVEWRALTVALLDRLAPLVRDRLGLDGTQLPLAGLLEGGTWAAGRMLAREAREGGAPPIRLASDGTVF